MRTGPLLLAISPIRELLTDRTTKLDEIVEKPQNQRRDRAIQQSLARSHGLWPHGAHGLRTALYLPLTSRTASVCDLPFPLASSCASWSSRGKACSRRPSTKEQSGARTCEEAQASRARPRGMVCSRRARWTPSRPLRKRGADWGRLGVCGVVDLSPVAIGSGPGKRGLAIQPADTSFLLIPAPTPDRPANQQPTWRFSCPTSSLCCPDASRCDSTNLESRPIVRGPEEACLQSQPASPSPSVWRSCGLHRCRYDIASLCAWQCDAPGASDLLSPRVGLAREPLIRSPLSASTEPVPVRRQDLEPLSAAWGAGLALVLCAQPPGRRKLIASDRRPALRHGASNRAVSGGCLPRHGMDRLQAYLPTRPLPVHVTTARVNPCYPLLQASTNRNRQSCCESINPFAAPQSL
ncbi:hypothetical protein F4861DRAFT_192623 [Xylaria intraflava]|nr:hypothetical protein F4861DRAFT_192623 [Xylaria intraflava]